MHKVNCFFGALMCVILGCGLSAGIFMDVLPTTMESRTGIDFWFLSIFSCLALGAFYGAAVCIAYAFNGE